MEGAVPRKEAQGGRLHHRTLSQASTTSSTMHSPRMASSTGTFASRSHPMKPPNASPTQIYHHNQHDKETASMIHQLHLPRESSDELKLSIPASSLLQERLQQERRAESERLARKFGVDTTSSVGDGWDGDIQNSPGKRYRHIEHVAELRPKSSHDDDSSQTGMGAKQIEKAVSTLHKQNFDLKLELFHRREKQSVLEKRVEELEREGQEMTDIQNNLLSEIINRDKAIEEAVNMIVKLEARLDGLVQENEMMRRFEVDESYRRSWSNDPNSLRAETPRPSAHGALMSTEPKPLDRMPSFLSDRSAQTQHLRSVVLRTRASLRHIRKFSEVSISSADASEANCVASPSVSMLSESSFVSIYGSKQGQDGFGIPSLDYAPGMDGTFSHCSPTPSKRAVMSSLPTRGNTSSSGTLSSAPRAATGLAIQAIPVNKVLRREAPLQKLEKPGEKVNSVDDTFGLATSSRRKSVVTPTPSQVRSNQERRETLQKVLTNYSAQNELANSHTLPPTPDTVSSSVLGKHQDPPGSEDAISRSEDAHAQRVVGVLLPQGNKYLRSLATRQEARPSTNGQNVALSTTSKDHPGFVPHGLTKSDENRRLSDLSHLAVSAAKAAPAGRPRSDSLVSDSDSDGGADARSDTASCDYWMRESYQPGENIRSTAHQDQASPPSPDLFSFPVDSEGWQPDAMFGALKGEGFLGSPVPGLSRDPTDELATSLQLHQPNPLESTTNGPEPPSRRSSLNGQGTGHFPLSSLAGKVGRWTAPSVVKADARARSNSVDGSGLMMRPGTRPDIGHTKRSHYPPIAGLQSRTRALGLNSLFSRSGHENGGTTSSGGELARPSSAAPRGPPISQAHLRHLKRPSGRMSVPPPATLPWAPRPAHIIENEHSSATPPPIMRNRPPMPQAGIGSGSPDVVTLETSQVAETGAYPVIMPTVVENMERAPSQRGGAMRKWLGLGRRPSLKNRVG
ncbi:hypothetical protein F5Y14DRAFT_100954 [Nemania sp. NC0429]|nr:hypothetical protein F5Y14DRAFT_100954 [Nemania sp. NC0429]